MKLLADECVPTPIILALRDFGHEVFAIRDFMPGATDQEVLKAAVELDVPLVTEDLDFGEMMFRQSAKSTGVIMFRLAGLDSTQKAAILDGVIREHADVIHGAFLVVTPGAVRIRLASVS